MAALLLRSLVAAWLLLGGVAFGHGTPALLFTTPGEICVANVSRSNKVTSIVQNLSEVPITLDFSHDRELVCWADNTSKKIQCIHVNTTHIGERMTIVDSNIISPDGLACDWYTGKLYWTDTERNRIEVTSIDERYRKVLFWKDINQPRAIALVPMRRFFFWTNWGDAPRIEKASMDGNLNSRKVVVSEDIYLPNGLSVDYEHELVYWLDRRQDFISVIDYNGDNRRKIYSKNLDYPSSLAYFDQKLYWGDLKTLSVYSLDLQTENAHELFIVENISGDVKVWDSRRQPLRDHPCLDNGKCSHLCLLSTNPQGYSCACPTGVKLLDEFNCAEGAQEILLIVQKGEVCKISLDTPDHTNFVLPLTDIKHPIAIDFDPVDEMVYWTDVDTHTIRRAKMDGTIQEDVTTNVRNSNGIAVDWVARNVYWTDTGTDRIEVARLNGSYRKVIITDDLVEPRAIAVAPAEGWMFWSDWNEKKPKIERSNLDGTERVALITKDIIWPNGLALDLDRKKLYWGDAKTHRIEMSNMDGTDRRVVLAGNLRYLFGFSLLGDFLYWTDKHDRTVSRVHKITGDQRQVIVSQVPHVMGLKAARRLQINGTNPCAANNGGCSQLCLNRSGGDYVCACQNDYELSKDMKNCVLPASFLLFAKRKNIGRISTQNFNIDNVIPVTGIKDASALGIDIADDRIYWADIKAKTISRAWRNGSNIEKVIELGLERPESLAVDSIARNLFWADSGTRKIEISRLNGGYRKVVIWQNITEPKCLALDPEYGYIYWCDWGNTGVIERAWLDGSHREVLLSDVGRAKGLAIDHKDRHLYWASLSIPGIYCYDLMTKKKSVVVSTDIGYPYSATQYGGYVYWTDWKTGNIERANKTSGGDRTTIHDHMESVTDLVSFDTSGERGSNACAENNGGCSHLCLVIPATHENSTTTYRCTCTSHYVLDSDGQTCIPPRNFIAFSLRNMIGRYLPDINDCPDILLQKPSRLKNIRSIEFDPFTRHLYWIDGRSFSIKKALDNGTHLDVVHSQDMIHPFDLALDPLGRLLFWSCSATDAINVTKLENGYALGVVVKGPGEKPRNIAVHPDKRLLFWTDVGNEMRVMMSTMDGRDRVTIATNLNQLTALAIDTISNLIFWAHGNRIEFDDIFGDRRRVLVPSTRTPILHLAVLFDFVYWYDRDSQTVRRVNKRNGSKKSIVMENRALTSFVSVITPDDHVMESHICSPFNDFGGCSHFCIDTEINRCSCPQTLVLAEDDRGCRAPPACRTDHFSCAAPNAGDAKDCILLSWKCDGQTDCADGSDEKDCPVCSDDQFRCHNGQCVDSSKVCDGKADCVDGLDESQCCQPGQFRCVSTGVCIPAAAFCDGFENCADGSDESGETCVANSRHQHDVTPILQIKSTYIVAVLVIIAIAIVAILGFYYRRKKTIGNEELPDILYDSAGEPLGLKSGKLVKPLLRQKSVRKDVISTTTTSIRMSTLKRSSIGSNHDHPHMAGTIRCSSSATYVQDVLCPPPSLATTTSSTRGSHCNVSRYKPYKHYRSVAQLPNVPPPTPCSTDDCKDSDTYATWYKPENDPFPPPPSPQSIYHSDAGTNSPSPCSRSSIYLSPLSSHGERFSST